jgi:rubrerythrin
MKTKKIPNSKELEKAFVSIEQGIKRGSVNTVICAVCGCIVNFKKQSPACSHLQELFDDIKKDPEYKKW